MKCFVEFIAKFALESFLQICWTWPCHDNLSSRTWPTNLKYLSLQLLPICSMSVTPIFNWSPNSHRLIKTVNSKVQSDYTVQFNFTLLQKLLTRKYISSKLDIDTETIFGFGKLEFSEIPKILYHAGHDYTCWAGDSCNADHTYAGIHQTKCSHVC